MHRRAQGAGLAVDDLGRLAGHAESGLPGVHAYAEAGAPGAEDEVARRQAQRLLDQRRREGDPARALVDARPGPGKGAPALGGVDAQADRAEHAQAALVDLRALVVREHPEQRPAHQPTYSSILSRAGFQRTARPLPVSTVSACCMTTCIPVAASHRSGSGSQRFER